MRFLAGISPQSSVAVSADQRHFGYVQTLLKKSAYSFMAQVMEMQISYSSPTFDPVPGQTKRIGRERKNPITGDRNNARYPRLLW
jgi:hypothetical protein